MICESLNYNKDTNGNYIITVQILKLLMVDKLQSVYMKYIKIIQIV